MSTIKELLLKAHRRHQPYINLANQIYKVEDLFGAETLKEYKKTGDKIFIR